MKSDISHNIKQREKARDKFYTPKLLAEKLISYVPLKEGDIVLDPALGNGAFYSQYPSYVEKDYCEIEEGKDFYSYNKKVDWIITNPPYSNLDDWIKKTLRVCSKGFAYLLGINNITPRRIEMINKRNFGLTFIHLCKVFKWYGISAFFQFEKEEENIISYDREVWREDTVPLKRTLRKFKKLDDYL